MNQKLLTRLLDGQPVLRQFLEDIFQCPITIEPENLTIPIVEPLNTLEELKDILKETEVPASGLQIQTVKYTKELNLDNLDFLAELRPNLVHFLELLPDRFVIVFFGKDLTKTFIQARFSKMAECLNTSHT